MINFECDKKGLCEIDMIRTTIPYEMNLSFNGNIYHIIVGKHRYGNYICIPNWDIGCELAFFSDTFWNIERLTRHIAETEATAIVKGLKLVYETYSS
jgi:hypothetical protein